MTDDDSIPRSIVSPDRPDSREVSAGPDVPPTAVDALNPSGRAPIDLRRNARYLSHDGSVDSLERHVADAGPFRWLVDTVFSELLRVVATLVVGALILAGVVLGSVWVAQRLLPDDLGETFGSTEETIPGEAAEPDDGLSQLGDTTTDDGP